MSYVSIRATEDPRRPLTYVDLIEVFGKLFGKK